MAALPHVRPSLLVTAGLVGGYAAASGTGRRELGGIAFGLAGVWAGLEWARVLGAGPALGLGAVYTAAMGGSHPLGHRIGPWPSVAAVTGATVLASELAGRALGR